jgi:outer membrane protein assembly factor BamE
MRAALRIIICLALTFSVSACSYFKFPGAHKVAVQQGNIITQEMVDQLRPGMTRAQVRFILGTPLISDTFNQNRWDYFYSLVDHNGKEVRERLVVFFEGDELARISGDYFPSSAATPDAAEAESETASP